MFVINCKNYEEIAGDKITKFIKTVEKVSKKYKIKIAVAPPQHLVGAVSKSSIPILAQHVDVSKIGSTTGFVVPELLKKSGILVCVKDVSEAKKYAKLNPDYIAIEPPELIGSGKAVSKEKPDLIVKAAKAVSSAKNKTKLLCGAGIVSGEDVSAAISLGSKGILVASGIVKAKNWNKIIEEFAKNMS
jgi:triosephosphate isomerase